MLAGPDSPRPLMRRALSRTLGALAAAIAADIDRTDDDRAFFTAEKAKIEPLSAELRAVHLAIEDHELGPAEVQQAQVEIGDEVLDRGVRAGNHRTKLGLRGQQGLGASHVFGDQVDDLVKTPIATEPDAVLDAVEKFDELPDFADKDAIRQDLTVRAEQQQDFLDDRNEGDKALLKLKSEATRLVLESSLALASLKGALDQRFPRQREYVARFFLDVRPKTTKKEQQAKKAKKEAAKAGKQGPAEPVG